MTAINPLIRFSPSVSPTSYESTYGSELTLGFQFALSESKQVSHLGIYYPSAGFTTSVTVNLWNDDPLSSPLISISIPAGTYSTVIDNFYWVPVPLTTLVGSPTGVRYMMGAVYSNNTSSGFTDPYVAVYPLVDLDLVEPNTTFNGGFAAVGDTYPYIPATSPGTASYFGPNISFKGKPTGQLWPLGVPDPLPVKSSPLLKFNPLEPPGSYESTASDSLTLGYQFGISDDKIVNKLGVYYPQGPSGFIHPVTIKLWTVTSPPVLLLTTTIPSGPCSDVVDGFCWVSVPETTLISGPTSSLYRLGAFYEYDEVTGSSPYVGGYPANSVGGIIVVEPSTSYIRGYSALGDNYPSTLAPIDTANYFGPNIGFKPKPTGQLWPIGSIFPEE